MAQGGSSEASGARGVGVDLGLQRHRHKLFVVQVNMTLSLHESHYSTEFETSKLIVTLRAVGLVLSDS